MNPEKASCTAKFLASMRYGIWVLCLPAWLFGVLGRSATALSDRALTGVDLIQVSTIAFFLMGWLLLKPHRLTNELNG
jgi:hypothetical protein